jgi:YesN/AraC family two-component response regulator
LAYEAIQYEVADYILKPLARIDFIKSILKLKKSEGNSAIVLAQPHVLNERPAVIVQHEVSAIEEPLIL